MQRNKRREGMCLPFLRVLAAMRISETICCPHLMQHTPRGQRIAMRWSMHSSSVLNLETTFIRFMVSSDEESVPECRYCVKGIIADKALCFHALLQVLILKDLFGQNAAKRDVLHK